MLHDLSTVKDIPLSQDNTMSRKRTRNAAPGSSVSFYTAAGTSFTDTDPIHTQFSGIETVVHSEDLFTQPPSIPVDRLPGNMYGDNGFYADAMPSDPNLVHLLPPHNGVQVQDNYDLPQGLGQFPEMSSNADNLDPRNNYTSVGVDDPHHPQSIDSSMDMSSIGTINMWSSVPVGFEYVVLSEVLPRCAVVVAYPHLFFLTFQFTRLGSVHHQHRWPRPFSGRFFRARLKRGTTHRSLGCKFIHKTADDRTSNIGELLSPESTIISRSLNISGLTYMCWPLDARLSSAAALQVAILQS